MSITKNWKIYYSIDEAISIWSKKIDSRAEKLFIQARENRLKKEQEDKKIEELFIQWKLDINKYHQYV